jgi:hypothetical protein
MILKKYKLLAPIFLILLYPLEIFSIFYGSIEIQPISIFIVFSLVFSIFYLAAGARFRLDIVSVLIFTYIVASCLASIRNPQIVSFTGFVYSFMILITYIYFISLVRDQNELGIVIKTIMIISLTLSVYAIVEQLSFKLFHYGLKPPFCETFYTVCGEWNREFGGGYTRARATFFGLNGLGGFLLPGFFLFFVQTKFKSKLLYHLLSFVIFFAILCTLSRNAILGLIVGFVVYYLSVSFIKSKDLSFFYIKLAVLISGFILLMLLNHFLAYDSGMALRLDLFRDLIPVSLEDSMYALKHSVESSLSIFITHLLAAIQVNAETFGLGMGIQLFDDYAMNYDYVVTWGSHSNFILFLGESGVFGFLAHVLIIFYIVYLYIDILKIYNSNYPVSNEVNYYCYIFIALFSSYLGTLVTGIVRTQYYNIYTFIIIALIVITYQHVKDLNSLSLNISK